MHGRSVPGSGRDLFDDFKAALRSWSWDVALLQEVPPWWPRDLATGMEGGVQGARVLTSRNALLPLRRAVAVRFPDVIKSNGGGANAILVRRAQIVEHRTLLLCLWPERRQLQAVRLASPAEPLSGLWVGNLHATVHDDAAARRDAERARSAALAWANGSALILGGDFNVRTLSLDGLRYAGGHDVDLVFASGLEPVGETRVLDRTVRSDGTSVALSDHAPVLVDLACAKAVSGCR